MPVTKKRRSTSFATFFGLLFFTVVSISVVLSVGNLLAHRDIIRRLEIMRKYVDSKVSEAQKELENFRSLMAPNSLLDKYIAAVNYLRDFGYDFEKILANLSDDPTTGYFMVFVAGNENVWFSVKSGERSIFGRELRPGLSDFRFFYFKEPRIRTTYDINVPPNATLVVGKPGKVYLLFFGVGLRFHPTKVVQLNDTVTENFAEKFSLYIPR